MMNLESMATTPLMDTKNTENSFVDQVHAILKNRQNSDLAVRGKISELVSRYTSTTN